MPHVIEKRETGSTSDDAKALARDGCASFTAVWAHRQTKGRGQHDRAWKSYDGSVFWSVVLRPDPMWHRHSDIIYVMSLAVISALDDLIGATGQLKLKWPNDIMLNDRKLGGTLTEASGPYIKLSSTNLYIQPAWIVSGTGINVVPVDDQPDMVYPPTSLHQEKHQAIKREDIIPRLIEATVREVQFWVDHGFAPVRERYLERAFNLGERMRFGVNPAKADYREGIYRGIDLNGAIILEDEHGLVQCYHSGEVIRQDGQ